MNCLAAAIPGTDRVISAEEARLTAELSEELPGILGWALDNLDRLATNGSFTEPASSADAITALQDLVLSQTGSHTSTRLNTARYPRRL